MEIIAGTGKQAAYLEKGELAQRLAGCTPVLVDLGTGDGRFVRAAALAQPRSFAIGLDACRENLKETVRKAPPNALFVIANALALPAELCGTATRLTINFPWGSLLEGLLAPLGVRGEGNPGLLDGMRGLCRAGAEVEVRLNGEALSQFGFSLERGGAQVRHSLELAGFKLQPPQPLDARALRAIPATWAKRLAFGREPRAILVAGRVVW